MLPKLSILMLLAAIVPESMSGPTNATLDIPTNITLLPKNPDRVRALMVSLGRFDITIGQFQDMVKTTPFHLGESINGFYSKFMTALINGQAQKGGNIAFSPFSIHIAMTMVLLASQQGSSTYQQLADALALKPDHTKDYLANVFQIVDYYKRVDTGFHMANNLYFGEVIQVSPLYTSLLYGLYGAKASGFGPDPEAQINEFIKANTNGMIEDFLEPDAIGPLTQLIAVNAIFHKDLFVVKFKKAWTGRMQFTPFDSEAVDYPTGMRVKTKELRTADTGDAYVLELVYENGFVMFVALPKGYTRADLEKVARDFNVEKVEKNLRKHPGGVEVLMPGLKMDCETDLVKVMEDMGVTDIFNHKLANLHHMTADKGLAVGEAIHKVVVEVDEEGSTAAASTGVSVCLRDPNLPECLEFDRPYSWFIVDRKHGTINFAGIVYNPWGRFSPDPSPSPSPKPL